MADESDPRIYFAAERTLLAWVRTGLAVIGLGFVVARFGLFLRLASRQPDVYPHASSTAIGVGLVLLGSAAVGVAAWQHVRFRRSLPATEQPQGYWAGWSVAFALVLALVGLALAGYLLLRSEVN